MKLSNWAVTAISLAILIGCAGGGTSTSVQRPGLAQPNGGIPGNGLETLPGVIPPLAGIEPVLDQGSEDHPGLPAFPGSAGGSFSPVHMVSEAEYKTLGDGFVNSFGANNRAGVVEGEYVLIPEEGGIAWAMYSIPDLTGDRPVRIDVAVSPAELEAGSGEGLLLSYWLGVADYTLYHWDWYGPFTGHKELEINSEKLKDRYVSEDGTLHWVAVLYGDEEDGLPGVTLQSGTVVTDPDYVTNNPHYTLVRSISVGGASESSKVASALEPSQYIRIVWNHVAEFGPHDVQNKAFEYKIYRRGPLDLNPQEIDSVPSPGNVYIDEGIGYPLREPPIPAPVPGAEYTYFIQALNLVGGYSPLSTPKMATAPLLPPESVTASIRSQLGRINLFWTAAEGADDYLVYRDLQDAPIATTGDVLTWDDDTLDPADGAEHTYWLRSVNQYVPEGSGSFSEPELGRQDTLPVAELIGAPGTGLTPLVVGFDAGTSHDPDEGTNGGEGIGLYEWDFNGDGIFSNEVGSLPEEDAAADTHPAGSTAQYTYADDGTFNPAVRVTDNEGNYTMQSVEITVGNSPPVADVSADPTTGGAPLDVDFDASGSTDVDGSIVNYEFDFDEGSGWEDYDGNPSAQHEYSDYGTYSAKVRVTDDDGGISTAGIEITVTSQQGDWHMFGRDEKHNRRSPNNGPATANLAWQYGTGSASWSSSPAVAIDGTIYIGSADNQLDALNPDGTSRGGNWPFMADNALLMSSPAVATDGTVYIGCYDSKLYAVNPDGTEKWRYPTGGIVNSSPTIGTDGTVYVGSMDNELYAINPDGSLKWSFPTGGWVYSTPAIGADGTVYVGSGDSNLYAINADGTEKWSYTTGGGVASSPAIGDDGTVYVGCDTGSKFYAINPDGSLKWFFTMGSDVQSSPAIGVDGTIYVGSFDDKLYAINPDGTLKWSYTTSGDVHSSPAVGVYGTVYFGSNDSSFYALNPDGSLRWSYLTGGMIESSPAIGADGTVYVGNYDNFVYAFGPGNAPGAVLIADRVEGSFPLTVNFDATGSFDCDGTIVDIEWDFDGNGIFNEVGNGENAARGNYSTSYTFTNWGVYRALVRLTDNDAKTDTASIDINTGFTWNTHTVESAGNVGWFGISIADLNGNPAIIYRDATEAALGFARSTSVAPSNGTDWEQHLADDPTNSVGAYCSLAVLGGNPIASYPDGGVGDLRFAQATTGTPTADTDWTKYAVDILGDTGYYTSIAVLDGKPAISYYANVPYNELRFARATVAEPGASGDWIIMLVDTPADVGLYTSLAILGGYPVISYYDVGNGNLKFARATTTSPVTIDDWLVHTVDSAGNVGLYTSLVSLNGLPAISYCDLDNEDLKFAIANTSTPVNSGDWQIHTVESTGDLGHWTSMAVINNRPVISYQEFTAAFSLRVAFAMNPMPDSNSDWIFHTPDSGGVGEFTALTLINGQPYIGYYDDVTDDIKLARPE